MKNTVLFLLVFVSLNTYSQTQSETESWLIYNLEKYFSTTKNEENKEYMWNDDFTHQTYYYSDFTFYIKEQYLIYMENAYSLPKDSTQGKLESSIKYTIDLSKVKKVEVDVDSLEVAQVFNHANFNFVFYYTRPYDGKTSNYYTYDLLAKKDKTEYGVNYGNYIFHFPSPSPIKSGITYRIAKAFEHLGELHGAPIVKDIF